MQKPWGAFIASALVLTCVCMAGPYPIRLAPDHRHVLDSNGAPFLIQGDAPWSLIAALTKEDAAKYLANRHAKGFNSIIVNLIEHKFNGPVNRYGQGPFTKPGDFTTPNEKYFEHADWVIRKAAENGIQVFLAPIYLGYPDRDEGWYDEAQANGVEKCRQWGRFVGRRYRDYDNIVWLMGGDRNPDAALAEVNAVVEGIREFDTRHLFTAHVHGETPPADEYKAGWLDLNNSYSYEIVHHRLQWDYDRNPPMPFFLIESTYEGEHNASPVQIRRQAYWAILLGATGQFFGNRPIWWFMPGWEEAMDAVGSRDMVHVKALFMSRPWHLLVPDEDHNVVVDGLGEFNGLDYLTAARTADGGTVIAYMPSARTCTVDMSRISGKSAVAWWFNPRNGESTRAGEFPTGGKHAFTPPGDGDWALVLDDASRKFPPPGRP